MPPYSDWIGLVGSQGSILHNNAAHAFSYPFHRRLCFVFCSILPPEVLSALWPQVLESRHRLSQKYHADYDLPFSF
jgi:hypothetical protein